MPGTAEANENENEISLSQIPPRAVAHPAGPLAAVPSSPKPSSRKRARTPGKNKDTRKRKRQPYHPNRDILDAANKIIDEYYNNVLLPLQEMEKRLDEDRINSVTNGEIKEANLNVFQKTVEYIDKSIEKLKPFVNIHN